MLGVYSICILFGWQVSIKQRDNVGPTAIRYYVVSPSANTRRRPDVDMALYVDFTDSKAWHDLATNQWPMAWYILWRGVPGSTHNQYSEQTKQKKICPLCRGGCGGRNWLKLFHIHLCAQACCRYDGDARFVSFTMSTCNTGFLKHDK